MAVCHVRRIKDRGDGSAVTVPRRHRRIVVGEAEDGLGERGWRFLGQVVASIGDLDVRATIGEVASRQRAVGRGKFPSASPSRVIAGAVMIG